jgi:hypothetical protein
LITPRRDLRAGVLHGPLAAHSCTAVVSLLAEAQRFLGPDEIVTTRPLRLVLDERPFI